jgi:Ulp1 family protease
MVVPFNIGGNHWVCAEVSFEDCTIQYHNLLHYGEHPFLGTLFRYMQEEHRRYQHGAFPFPELADPSVASLHQRWKILPCTDKSTPRQPNGYDCGMYVCAIVDCIMRGLPLQFEPYQLQGYRDTIALALITGEAPAWTTPFFDGGEIPAWTTPFIHPGDAPPWGSPSIQGHSDCPNPSTYRTS